MPTVSQKFTFCRRYGAGNQHKVIIEGSGCAWYVRIGLLPALITLFSPKKILLQTGNHSKAFGVQTAEFTLCIRCSACNGVRVIPSDVPSDHTAPYGRTDAHFASILPATLTVIGFCHGEKFHVEKSWIGQLASTPRLPNCSRDVPRGLGRRYNRQNRPGNLCRL